MFALTVSLAGTALSAMLGRSSSRLLHGTASRSFARHAAKMQGQSLAEPLLEHILNECESGSFTDTVTLVGEVVGIILFAPLWDWSALQGSSPPFNASCVFLGAAVLLLFLYFFAFSLNVNSDGVARFQESNVDSGFLQRCIANLGYGYKAAVRDVTCLFDDLQVTGVRMLDQRSRTASETSFRTDLVERGETTHFNGRKVH